MNVLTPRSVVETNFSLKGISKKKAYLLYVGGPKHAEYNSLFPDALKDYYKKQGEVVYVLPNPPSRSFKHKYVVVNDKLLGLKKNKADYYYVLGQEELQRQSSENPFVKKLVKKILEGQENLFVSVFKETSGMTLHHYKRVSLIGPKEQLYHKYENRLYQHEMAKILDVPVPEWFLANNKKEMIRLYKKHFKGKAFISKTHSLGCKGIAEVNSLKEVLEHSLLKNENQRYILSKPYKIKESPTCSGIIANQEQVFLCPVTDQVLEGPEYVGTIYPSKLGGRTLRLVKEYTLRIARYLGTQCYKGFFDVDFFVTDKGKLFFSEVNPRRDASSVEKALAYQTAKQEGFPSLPGLEFKAVAENTLPEGVRAEAYRPGMAWATLDVLVEKGYKTGKASNLENERQAFENRRAGLLFYAREGAVFLNDCKLGKIVSVGDSRKRMLKALKKEKNRLENLGQKQIKIRFPL